MAEDLAGSRTELMFVAPLWPQMKTSSTLKKGKLYLQSSGLFTRWHTRFFVLTTDFLQCYKTATNKYSSMGDFMFQVKLAEVIDVDIFDREDGMVVIVVASQDGERRYIRSDSADDTRDWYTAVTDGIRERQTKVNHHLATFPRQQESPGKTDDRGKVRMSLVPEMEKDQLEKTSSLELFEKRGRKLVVSQGERNMHRSRSAHVRSRK